MTGKPPLVSVVMTAYDAEAFIASAIDSALAQTFRDFELIVMDDGSMDGTVRIAERYADPRMQVVRAAHRGPAAQLHDGTARARGQYLALFDADDLWDTSKLARHVEFLNSHPSADLTFSWSRILDEEGRDSGVISPPWIGPISFPELLSENVIVSASALVFRHEAFLDAGGIDPTLDACFDLDVCLRIASLRSGNVWAIPELLNSCRRRKDQITTDADKVNRSFERLLQKARWFAPRTVPLVEPLARSNMQRFCARALYQTGDYGKALWTLVQSLRRDPRVFSADRRNWEMSAAALSGLLLPGPLHRRVIHRRSPRRA